MTRLRLVVAAAVLLGLAQVLFEDVVLFVATTRDGLPGTLSSPLVAVAVPFAIATLLLATLVGGALWSQARGDRTRHRRNPDDRDPDDSDELDPHDRGP